MYLDQSLQDIHYEIANQIHNFVGGNSIVQIILEYTLFRMFCGNSTCRQFLPYQLQCGCCLILSYQIRSFWCPRCKVMQSPATSQKTQEIICKCGQPLCTRCRDSHTNSRACWINRDMNSHRLLQSRSYSFCNLL